MVGRTIKVTVDYDNGCYNITGCDPNSKEKRGNRIKMMQSNYPIREKYDN